ncbi:hypothetical protein HMN09_00475200 [Mycena chlorophos]|uniref:Uncharacterized protein n=1 Tax=Mycena chlorophos TaxID=658473 RepID=A0A8H6THP0_MYCCL|nr:hypothetical protein HMN09_00475200 [Mycena chlorophos]
MPTLHPALRIPEMILNIVSQAAARTINGALLPPSLQPADSSTTLRWTSFGVHPFTALRIDSVNQRVKPISVTLRRPCSPGDWDRPAYYAKRVKSLRCQISERPHLERHWFTLNTLALVMPGGAQDVLFPCLRTLHWVIWVPIPNPFFFRLFLAPTLTSVEFTGEPTVCVSLLRILDSRNLQLTTFGLVSGKIHPVARPHLAQFIRKHPRLERVALPTLDQTFLKLLGDFPHLTSLEADSPTYGSREGRAQAWLQSTLPLRNLWLDPTPAADSDLTTNKLTHLFDQIAACCPSGTLRSFIFGVWREEPCSERPPDLTAKAFLSLRVFAHITTLCLYVDGAFDFGDGELNTVAQACPHLVTLTLSDHAYLLDSRLQFTFNALTILCQTNVCPSPQA